uniref:Leucine rich repeat family protein n=1 Tax=Musa balbisiana TaxID=52838 RepID=Q1EP59_MUSBA|nr:leucine rich repeat family protein [Musa balbisiana]
MTSLTVSFIRDLSFNNLSGAIPTTFQNLRVSDSMFLNNNNLSGPVPDWISTGKRKHMYDQF